MLSCVRKKKSSEMRFRIVGLPLTLRVLAAQLGRREELHGGGEIPSRLAIVVEIQFRFRAPGGEL